MGVAAERPGTTPAAGPAEPAPGGGDTRAVLAALAALTAVALGLRVWAATQSLYGDEVFTYAVANPGFGGIVGRIQAYELNPPLFHLIATASIEVFGGAKSIRVPSVLCGTALVPATYALGARTVGRRAGLIGAALIAVAPFAVFFGSEGRAYALLMLLAVGTALALVRALRANRPAAWGAYGALSAAALYTHYTAAFALAAMALAALAVRRDRWRGLLLANACVALAYLPWLPYLSDQQGKPALTQSMSAGRLARDQLQALVGHPLIATGGAWHSLERVPGVVALVLVALGIALAAAGLAVAARPGGRSRPADRPGSPGASREGVALLAALALSAPVGLVAYWIAADRSLLLPRNFAIALPAVMLLAGWALARAPRVLGIASLVALLAGLSIGTLRVETTERRPRFDSAAEEIAARGRAGDPVVAVSTVFQLFGNLVTRPSAEGALARRILPGGRFVPLSHFDSPLKLEFRLAARKPYRQYDVVGFLRLPGGRARYVADPAVWAAGRRTGRVFVVGVDDPTLLLPRAPRGFRLALRRTFAGLAPVTLLEYEPVR